jgi:hypothetical protein
MQELSTAAAERTDMGAVNVQYQRDLDNSNSTILDQQMHIEALNEQLRKCTQPSLPRIAVNVAINTEESTCAATDAHALLPPNNTAALLTQLADAKLKLDEQESARRELESDMATIVKRHRQAQDVYEEREREMSQIKERLVCYSGQCWWNCGCVSQEYQLKSDAAMAVSERRVLREKLSTAERDAQRERAEHTRTRHELAQADDAKLYYKQKTTEAEVCTMCAPYTQFLRCSKD